MFELQWADKSNFEYDRVEDADANANANANANADCFAHTHAYPESDASRRL